MRAEDSRACDTFTKARPRLARSRQKHALNRCCGRAGGCTRRSCLANRRKYLSHKNMKLYTYGRIGFRNDFLSVLGHGRGKKTKWLLTTIIIVFASMSMKYYRPIACTLARTPPHDPFMISARWRRWKFTKKQKNYGREVETYLELRGL